MYRDEQGTDHRLALDGAVSHAKPQTGGTATLVRVQTARGLETFSEPHSPRKLFLDIENRPNLMHVWDVWKPNYSDAGMVEPQEIMCFAAGWADSEEVLYYSKYHDGRRVMLEAIHALLEEADIVIHYFGKKHDIPHINTDLIVEGFTPPSPYKQIDLYDTIKHKFGFAYNGLDHVCRRLGLSGKSGGKPGFENWVKLLADDADAWQAVMEYNIQDVIALKELYYTVRPWISSHPNVALFLDSPTRKCSKCQSSNVQFRGFSYTNAGVFRRIRCNDCGGWSKLPKRVNTTETRNIPD